MPKKDADVKRIIISSLEELLANAGQEEDDDEVDAAGKRRKIVAKRATEAARVRNPMVKNYGDDELKYYNKMTTEQKTYIAVLEKSIMGLNKDHIPLRFKILTSKIDEKIKAIAIKKLEYLYGMESTGNEYYKMSNWIEALCKLPIGKYRPLPISKSSSVADVRKFIQDTQRKLDETVYAHSEAKDQIIRLLAQWISNPDSKGMVIGIQGSPGTGKTLLAKYGISKALDLPFAFLALGGASDASWLDGHSYTYEGSSWGKIADILMKADCMNPVLYLDELDKVSATYRGEEIINILIHLTDSTQNDKYQDKYFVDVDMDLSRSLIIFSYNDDSLVSPILKDRMIKIKTHGYKINDKIAIGQGYLLPDLLKEFSMQAGDIVFPDGVIKYIISNKIQEEDGVRNLKRAFEQIISKINLKVLLNPEDMPLPVTITEALVNTYLKAPQDLAASKMHQMYL